MKWCIYSNLERALGLLAVLATCTLPAPVTAQETTSQDQSPNIEMQAGWLTENRQSLNVLLSLKINSESRLMLDRKIWELNARSAEERKKAAIQQWIDRGLDAERAKEFAERRGSSEIPSAFEDAIDRVVTAAGRGGHGRSGSGNSFGANYRCQHLWMLVKSEGDLREIFLKETESPRRILQLNDDGKKQFSLLLSGDELIVRIKQLENQPIQVVMLLDDEVFQTRSKNFAAFASQHPSECDQLLNLLSQIGFDAPPMRNSPQVAIRVKQDLMALHGEAQAEFDKIATELDANEFNLRESARTQLLEQYESFGALIRAKLAEKGNSLEAQRALTAIIREGNEAAGDTRVIDYVVAEGLIASPVYLVELLEDSNDQEKEAIVKQLEKTTGQSLGKDLNAWKKLLRENSVDD